MPSGKTFFTEGAPCTNVKAFYGRFIVGLDNKNLHEKFSYHFSLKNNPVDVTVTVFYCDKTQRVWVSVRPVSVVTQSQSANESKLGSLG
jgi:chemotaxis family two-component system sensor kinase Cph1